MPPQWLENRLSLYNVRWVLCWSRPCKAYFGRLAQAALVGDYHKFRLYRMLGRPSYFLRGEGSIEQLVDHFLKELPRPKKSTLTRKAR